MSTLLRSFLLLAVVAGLMISAGAPVAPAQVKDKDKKDDKKDVKKSDAKDEEIGVTEVYMAKDGWRFRIKNAEGKSIAIGTVGHEKKEEALKTVELLKATLTKGKVVEIKEEKK